MYINPFLAGAIATIAAELLVIVTVIAIVCVKNSRK